MYQKVEFPKWLYHRDLPARIVRTQEEMDALGPEWAETDAAWRNAERAEEPVETAVPTAPAKADSGRCACGKYTLANALKKQHVCEASE